MKFFFLPLTVAGLVLFSGCSGTTDEPEIDNPKEQVTGGTFEERAKREIEAGLKIPTTEKYGMKVYKAYLNDDGVEDAIITVNRMEFAMDEAIRKNKVARAAEVGYMGNYNYFLYYDGAKDKFSYPVTVPSSPGRPLDVSFAPITSPTSTDIVIEYRIMNSAWRNYYTMINNRELGLMFQWKVFDHAGEEKPEAYLYELEDGLSQVSKDLMIYESQLENNDVAKKDIYKFEPVIKQKGKLVYHFFYDPRQAKFCLAPEGQ